MAGILVHTGDESVTLSAQATKRLLEKGSGDAALLYIALLRRHGTVTPRALAGELRWERSRIEAAEVVLQELGLIAAEEAVPPEPADEKPEYQRAEVAEHLEGDEAFRLLVTEVERKLGKRLSTPDVASLLGLYDYLGLPTDVIYLLVCHCAERAEERLGPGRRPGMRQIEKEGYAWARMGVDNQEAAVAHLRKYADRQALLPRYMRALQLPERKASATEEKYMNEWQEMGFPPETVAIAYDRTVLNCRDFKWPYCNGILKRWHEAGLHTVEEIQNGEQKAAPRKPDTVPAGTRTNGGQQEDISWMKEYIQQRDRYRTKREEA